MDYLWVYLLGSVALITLLIFVVTFSKDLYLTRKLKLNKVSLVVNFSLLATSLTSVGLVIYLFSLLKQQIEFFG